jgi:hypothetical protein
MTPLAGAAWCWPLRREELEAPAAAPRPRLPPRTHRRVRILGWFAAAGGPPAFRHARGGCFSQNPDIGLARPSARVPCSRRTAALCARPIHGSCGVCQPGLSGTQSASSIPVSPRMGHASAIRAPAGHHHSTAPRACVEHDPSTLPACFVAIAEGGWWWALGAHTTGGNRASRLRPGKTRLAPPARAAYWTCTERCNAS